MKSDWMYSSVKRIWKRPNKRTTGADEEGEEITPEEEREGENQWAEEAEIIPEDEEEGENHEEEEGDQIRTTEVTPVEVALQEKDKGEKEEEEEGEIEEVVGEKIEHLVRTLVSIG